MRGFPNVTKLSQAPLEQAENRGTVLDVWHVNYPARLSEKALWTYGIVKKLKHGLCKASYARRSSKLHGQLISVNQQYAIKLA